MLQAYIPVDTLARRKMVGKKKPEQFSVGTELMCPNVPCNYIGLNDFGEMMMVDEPLSS